MSGAGTNGEPEPAPAGLPGLIRAFYRAIDPRRRLHLLFTLGLMLVAALTELITIGAVLPFLALLADPAHSADIPGFGLLVALAGSASPSDLLFLAGALLCGASIAAGLARLTVLRATNRLAFALGHDLGVAIFSRTLRQPYSVYVGRNPSEVFAGVDKVQTLIFSMLLPLMQGMVAGVTALAILIVLTAVAPAITLASAGAVVLIYVAVSLATGRRLKSNSAAIASAATARMKALQEGFGGLRDIILGQTHDAFEDGFNALDRGYRQAQAENQFINAAPRVVLETSAIVLAGLLALYMSRGAGGLAAAIPVLGALALGTQRLLPLLNACYVGWSQVGGNSHLLRDILGLLQIPVVGGSGAAASPAAFTRAITFDGVSLHHPGRDPALRDVSLEIPRGARLGIVGPTGSGKSSLLDLLMGLIDPTAGEIRIDGRPLDDSIRAGWQSAIAHVPQSIYVADLSIAANIAFGRHRHEIDMGRVKDAARAARLDAFVESLPEGYATLVGERGVRLSGGQRQRIAIARAFYKRAGILILDEPTSQLDADAEQAIVATLAAMAPDVTIVMVAHHEPALWGCDLILRLGDGAAGGLVSNRATARRRAV